MKCVTCGSEFAAECDGAPLRPTCLCQITRESDRRQTMKIEIEATDKTTESFGVETRMWKGKTENGIECFLFVHRIAVANDKDTSEFEAELAEKMPPAMPPIDLRFLLP